MVFKCQEDSFLKQFSTRILSCEPGTLEWTAPGATEPNKLKGFNVICENTILFPEGGGQPCDFGTINGYPVRNVIRKGSEAIHFIESNTGLEENSTAVQCVDWERRFDHMQQHTGQHLITALFDSEFKYDTTSWRLGTDISTIELNTAHLISRESLDLIERKANDLIREGRQLNVLLVDPEESLKFPDVRAPRGLPKDFVGLARVVRIEGIESNMCCGTHVNNLSQLQCVKLLYAEKTKNCVNVHFVIGQRVIRKLDECFQRELQINLALKGGPKQHLDLIQKLQNNLKAATKSYQKLLKETAILEAEKLDNWPKNKPKYYTLHRKDGIEPDFISTFLRNAPDDFFYFLTVSESGSHGDGVSKGQLVLSGEPTLVQKFGPLFLEILEGKGNGKDKSFQGRFSNISKIKECDKLLEEYFCPTKSHNIELIETM